MLRTIFGLVGVLLLLGTAVLTSGSSTQSEEWGFFGHRRINRMAVFTLPPEMMRFFRYHIEYVTDHAVDPDKRRYATKHEAVRHYIDIDHWGTHPFNNVPRDWTEALLRFGEIQVFRQQGDTLHFQVDTLIRSRTAPDLARFALYPGLPVLSISLDNYRQFWDDIILPQYYEDEWIISCEDIEEVLGVPVADCQGVKVIDHFSGYGIVPYHLEKMQRQMTTAFENMDANSILRLCAEMGHYIGDAHVPLHTTENYNGEMTNQVGIHAFWESRLPELFADKSYDFFVGRAEYIDDPKEYYWDAVLDSHALLDSVLAIEKHLSLTFPRDQQYCFEERLGRTIRTQCTEYAQAYHDAMNGMVEARMRRAVLAIGSAWFTAWVDAGQPDLSRLLDEEFSQEEESLQEQLDRAFEQGENKGRSHEE